jgi:uncharacterized membrane protein YsdA (DUF1294 family)
MSIYFYIVLAAVIVWNIVTFSLYAIDKAKAKKNQWRISEATLIICAFLMGGIGALLGMHILRHKTQHIKFKLLVPIAVIVNIAALVGCYLLLA